MKNNKFQVHAIQNLDGARLRISLLVSQFFNENGFVGHGGLDVALADRIVTALPSLLSLMCNQVPEEQLTSSDQISSPERQ